MADFFAAPDIAAERRDDGTIVLRSNVELEPYEVSLGHLLRRWAREAPERVFLAERPGGDPARPWRTVTYREAERVASSLAQSLLDRGVSVERPVVILSGNSVAHGLLMVAGFLAGIPVVPVSPAYSLLATEFDKLTAMVDTVKPGLVFAEETLPFERALGALDLLGDKTDVTVCTGDGGVGVSLETLGRTRPGAELESRSQSVDGDTVAKILFTSGSTGHPKGVVTTHRMLCSNQQAMAQVWPFMAETPPVLCDWLPWSHTFGGSHDFNLVLRNGGSLYIDAGRPSPQMIGTTLANIRDVEATISLNVPAGFAALTSHLESDEELAARYFARLQLIFYASAALPADVWRRLDALAVKTLGHRVRMTSSWGATETAPAVTNAHYDIDRAGVVGVPLPGAVVKLVPAGTKLEARVAGAFVTDGYLGRADLTSEAFDEEGFYRIGDAMRLVDPDDPNKGLVFDGRIAEDFKLQTGTWVNVGILRAELLSATAPLLGDLVVAGEGRSRIGLMVWLAPGVTDTPDVRDQLRARLASHNRDHTGSATSVERFCVLSEPASLDRGEITDKGYVNRRAVLEHRASVVDALFSATSGPDAVLVP